MEARISATSGSGMSARRADGEAARERLRQELAVLLSEQLTKLAETTAAFCCRQKLHSCLIEVLGRCGSGRETSKDLCFGCSRSFSWPPPYRLTLSNYRYGNWPFALKIAFSDLSLLNAIFLVNVS